MEILEIWFDGVFSNSLTTLRMKAKMKTRGATMVELTGLNQKKFILNHSHIEKIEEVPETVITLTNGKKYLVKECVEDIIEKCIHFQRKTQNLEHLK